MTNESHLTLRRLEGPVAVGWHGIFDDRVHNEKGAALSMAMSANDIFAEHGQRQKLHIPQDEKAKRGPHPTFQGNHPAHPETDNARHENGTQTGKTAGQQRDTQARKRRKRGDGIEGQLEQPAIAVLRLPPCPLMANERDADLAEADPADQTAKEPWIFLKLAIHIKDAAIHEAKIACIRGNRHVGNAAHETIKEVRSGFFQEAFALAFLANTVDYLIAFAPLGEKLPDQFGRILQVRIHNYGSLSTRVMQTGGCRHFVSKIAG